MSIFWDHRSRKPQIWVYPFFIILTVLLCVGIFQYGSLKAGGKGSAAPEDKRLE